MCLVIEENNWSCTPSLQTRTPELTPQATKEDNYGRSQLAKDKCQSQ